MMFRSSGWRALPLISLIAVGCAATPPPAKPAEPVKAAPPAAPPAPAPPAEPPATREKNEEITPDSSRKDVDVVDPGGERGPMTLVEAARAERERRARSGPPVAVITDKNVSKSKGHLTVADPKKPKSAEEAAALQTVRDEQYWRSRALDIRTRLRQATDRVQDLELSAAGWRRRFYAEEDPYYRDGKIKPEWDRILAQLEETRNEVGTTRKELDDFLEEGRRAGALPGWLREGGELEPPAEEKPKTTGPGTVDAQEPQIYEQPPPPGHDQHEENDAA